MTKFEATINFLLVVSYLSFLASVVNRKTSLRTSSTGYTDHVINVNHIHTKMYTVEYMNQNVRFWSTNVSVNNKYWMHNSNL